MRVFCVDKQLRLRPAALQQVVNWRLSDVCWQPHDFLRWGRTRAMREAPLQPLYLVLQAIPLRAVSTAASAS